MKTKFTLLAICFFSICSSFSPAKNSPVKEKLSVTKKILASSFEFFRTHRQGRAGITATWALTLPGNDVSGFIVEKTYEDPYDIYANWEIVSAMPNSGARSFKCTDNNVLPGYISYRVTATFLAGGSCVAPISTVHIISH